MNTLLGFWTDLPLLFKIWIGSAVIVFPCQFLLVYAFCSPRFYDENCSGSFGELVKRARSQWKWAVLYLTMVTLIAPLSLFLMLLGGWLALTIMTSSLSSRDERVIG